MIAYGYVALRQFPKFERHVLAAEMRHVMWEVLRLIVVCNKQLDHQTKCTVLLPKIEDITNVEACIK